MVGSRPSEDSPLIAPRTPLECLLDEERLACPTCRRVVEGRYQDWPLRLLDVMEERGGRPWQAFLICAGCASRYPVIDGVPVIVADVAAWLRQQERPVLGREDLDPTLAGWIAAAWPDDQDPNWRKQMLSIYAATLRDPVEPEDDAFSVELTRQIQRSREQVRARQAALIAAAGPSPLVLDAGTAAGAAALDLAALGARVLALDHDFAGLRLLAQLIVDGRVQAPRWRHGGYDYDEVEIEVGAHRAAVLPIAADALAPPLRPGSVRMVTAYNLLDNVTDPVLLLQQLQGVLEVGGDLVLSSPYDWVSRATPRARRLGASIRLDAAASADPAPALLDLLAGRLGLAPGLHLRGACLVPGPPRDRVPALDPPSPPTELPCLPQPLCGGAAPPPLTGAPASTKLG